MPDVPLEVDCVSFEYFSASFANSSSVLPPALKKSALCTEKYNKLGQQASMGCVRLTVEDAKWIADNCPSGTTVEIYEDDDPGPLGKPEAAHIDTDSPNKGWDPTDPDVANPWHQLSDDE